MKIRFLLTLLLLLHSFAFAFSTQQAYSILAAKNKESGGTPAIYGECDISGATQRASTYLVRCVEITPTANIDMTYAWFYGSTQDASAGTFEISVFNMSDVQQGSCSSTGTLPVTGSEAWNEVTFSPISLTGSTTYKVCAHLSEDYEFWDTGSAAQGWFANSGSCPTAPTGTTTYEAAICVGDYNAK